MESSRGIPPCSRKLSAARNGKCILLLGTDCCVELAPVAEPGFLMGHSKTERAKKYTISGRVQGVGFRFFAERWANQLGIRGYVKNCWEGTVEVYAIGDEISLEEFKRQLAEGPRSASV